MQEIELAGRKFPVLFSVNAVEEIQKKYENVTELAGKLKDHAEVKWILAQTINAGLAYQAYLDSRPAEKVQPEELGAIMQMKDFQTAVDVIVDAFCESMGTEKNSVAGDLKIIANLTAEVMEKSTFPG